MKARFSAEYTVSCSSCGTRKEIKMPAPSGDLHFALASVDVAHSQARRWLIDHAKTCEGNALVLGPQTAADVNSGQLSGPTWSQSDIAALGYRTPIGRTAGEVVVGPMAEPSLFAPDSKKGVRGTAQHWGSTGHKEWCAFHRTVRIDPGGNAVGDCDCGAV